MPIQQEEEDALRRRDVSELTNLINSGVDVNTLVIPKHTDILLTAINREHRSLFNTVLAKGFKCDNNNGFLYMHHAIRTHDLFFVDSMMEQYRKCGLDINEHNSNSENCLHIAAGENEIDENVFEVLTNLGISWTEKNMFGHTPLHILLVSRKIIGTKLIELLSKHLDAFIIPDPKSITPKNIITKKSQFSDWSKNNHELIVLANRII